MFPSCLNTTSLGKKTCKHQVGIAYWKKSKIHQKIEAKCRKVQQALYIFFCSRLISSRHLTWVLSPCKMSKKSPRATHDTWAVWSLWFFAILSWTQTITSTSFPLSCKWHFPCSTWDKTTPAEVRLPKWKSCFCRKCWCRRVARNCNTCLRMQLGWVSETTWWRVAEWKTTSTHLSPKLLALLKRGSFLQRL